ncbi:phBC6A51 family helix-turn-helix protein [Aneurinibacillus thermoaerophilus]|uniref:phBC6A51 family helix-turn-helix protein n=1 Tax=Aneurinibacillus thermoaerophilus TaxID=143495 RepID=UPI002E1AAE95|nr:phBC6A51 family helix-turn-helix protein [Aneurinibacillus thermoaerophilus]
MAQKGTDKGLTKKEKMLLEVLLDPANRMKTVAEICRLVPCDRKIYYRAFKNPAFVEEYRQMSTELAQRHLSQVMNAFVKEAVRGSFQHGKVLLEMAGVYTEKVKQEHSGQINQKLDMSGLSVEELRRLAKLDQ